MIDNIKFEKDGCRFCFTWMGDETDIVVYIIDGYSKLKFYKSRIKAGKNCGYWIETPNNVKHKIFEIYDDKEEYLFFKIENEYGAIDLSILDSKGYSKNIGFNHLSHDMLAVPLYEIYVTNLYEHPKCKINENDIVFDIGANIGMFTYYALNKDCEKCYSFEPNKELYNVIKNKNINNVIIENVAVSIDEGIESFFLSNGGISSCLERDNNMIMDNNGEYYRGPDTFKKIEVKTINIMDYIKSNNINNIDYFKCDCEGAEYDIIDSLDEDYLKNNIKKAMIEYHYLYNPIFRHRYDKMILKLTDCGFVYENNSDVEKVNDGVLFLWKEN